jgi:hypothetical protein
VTGQINEHVNAILPYAPGERLISEMANTDKSLYCAPYSQCCFVFRKGVVVGSYFKERSVVIREKRLHERGYRVATKIR